MYFAGLQSALRKATTRQEAGAFSRPVAEVCAGQPFLADYEREIQHPMDLGTLQRNLSKGCYEGEPAKAHSDLQLVWENCAKFNGQSAELTKQAYRLRLWFEKELQDSVWEIEDAPIAKRFRTTKATASPTKRARIAPAVAPPATSEKALAAQIDAIEREHGIRLVVIEDTLRYTDRLDWWEIKRLTKNMGKLEGASLADAMKILRQHPPNRVAIEKAEADDEAEYTLDLASMPHGSLRKLEAMVKHVSLAAAKNAVVAAKDVATDAMVLREIEDRLRALKRHHQCSPFLSQADNASSSDSDSESDPDSESDSDSD